jgi:hypothetical protein
MMRHVLLEGHREPCCKGKEKQRKFCHIELKIIPCARNSIKNQKNLGIEEHHTKFERTRYEKLKDLIGKRMWKFE